MRGSITAAAAAAILLAACGGGGGDGGSPAPAPSPSAAGLYTGKTDNNRQTSVLVLDDGRVYSLYSVAGVPSTIAGGVIGSGTSSNGTISNGTGLDYNLEGQGVNAVTFSGTYSAKASLNATIVYSNGSKTVFNGAFDSSYNTTPTQAAVTGTFKGSAATNLGSDTNVTITADANGSISGTGTGCAFTGSIKPHASGNVYDVTLNFGGGSCAYPNTAATGVALLSGSTLHAELQTPAKAGVLFLGTKQ
ncbi:hypothetical protein AB6809_35635 [Paraburkholderia sp. RCC_158]|uniref:hypothetical protein n=1 Tax=Paraburkholderia sp. RCC_158 TaxID=3239220 RepID=UPI0035265322